MVDKTFNCVTFMSTVRKLGRDGDYAGEDENKTV